MEFFVELLNNRLDKDQQMMLLVIMDNAINEMHNNQIIDKCQGELYDKIHDPDPNVRVTEKTSLAKSIGYSMVVSSETGKSQNGVCQTIVVDYDERFPNSLAICIQGGLEGLYQSKAYKKTKSGVMDYYVKIINNGQDVSRFLNNLNILNDLYNEFNIQAELVSLDDLNSDEQNDNQQSNTTSTDNIKLKKRQRILRVVGIVLVITGIPNSFLMPMIGIMQIVVGIVLIINSIINKKYKNC